MSANGAKRPREDGDDASSSSDDDFGPSLPTDAPKPKKRKKLPYEKLYVAALPASPRYSRSLMHKDQLSFVTFTSHTDFLITSSIDGVIKFWKKTADGIEFVKEFRAHNGEITSVSVSADGRSFASSGADGTVKIFDVVTFDLLAMLTLEGGSAGVVYWVHGKGASLPLLAVGMASTPEIRIFDGRGENATPLKVIKGLHRTPVACMAFNAVHDCVVSADEGGMVEYWSPSNNYEKPENVWKMKSSTNLFDFKKAKSAPVCVNISPSGKYFATYSFPDRKIRVFEFSTGKLYRTYDESLETISEMQHAGTALVKLEDVEFGRRMGVENDLSTPATRSKINILFDESSNFIIYGSLLGTKVINTLTNRVVKLYGQDEPFRPLNLCLYQGQPQQKKVVTIEMAASTNPLLAEAEARDAMLVATGVGKVRFYAFTNETDVSKSTRDVQNERPRDLAKKKKTAQEEENEADGITGQGAVLHTTYGDVQMRLFPGVAPKAVENFTTHARNGYYNNVLFHRVIRKFMIQTGDPLGDGTGGDSIWGSPFEDEFSDQYRHDKPYTVSMANAGPRTNGSQFFITTEKTPWLDNKHTVFGRVVKGIDVVHKIENARTHKERPEEDIRIVNISIRLTCHCSVPSSENQNLVFWPITAESDQAVEQYDDEVRQQLDNVEGSIQRVFVLNGLERITGELFSEYGVPNLQTLPKKNLQEAFEQAKAEVLDTVAKVAKSSGTTNKETDGDVKTGDAGTTALDVEEEGGSGVNPGGDDLDELEYAVEQQEAQAKANGQAVSESDTGSSEDEDDADEAEDGNDPSGNFTSRVSTTTSAISTRTTPSKPVPQKKQPKKRSGMEGPLFDRAFNDHYTDDQVVEYFIKDQKMEDMALSAGFDSDRCTDMMWAIFKACRAAEKSMTPVKANRGDIVMAMKLCSKFINYSAINRGHAFFQRYSEELEKGGALIEVLRGANNMRRHDVDPSLESIVRNANFIRIKDNISQLTPNHKAVVDASFRLRNRRDLSALYVVYASKDYKSHPAMLKISAWHADGTKEKPQSISDDEPEDIIDPVGDNTINADDFDDMPVPDQNDVDDDEL